jgi:ATP-dependent DNA helicase RecQ
VPLSGKIAPREAASVGRVLARLTDIGWGTKLRSLVGGSGDRPVPDDVFAACVQVLASWDWAVRPVGVVTISSGTRPTLVRDLGERLAKVGRLDMIGELDGVNGGGHPPNSARRVAQLWSTLIMPAELAAKMSTVDGPVLLVDDLVDSGWTMTLAARMLRKAGAPAVLPFALAVAG